MNSYVDKKIDNLETIMLFRCTSWEYAERFIKTGNIRFGKPIEWVEEYKKHHFPLSVIGLEPGWQSGSYPCTYDWSARFPNAERMIRNFLKDGVRVNLWENPCISEKSSVYEKSFFTLINFKMTLRQ